MGRSGAAVHQERGKQHAEAGAGHHPRAGRAAPQELLSWARICPKNTSQGDPRWVMGFGGAFEAGRGFGSHGDVRWVMGFLRIEVWILAEGARW